MAPALMTQGMSLRSCGVTSILLVADRLGEECERGTNVPPRDVEPEAVRQRETAISGMAVA